MEFEGHYRYHLQSTSAAAKTASMLSRLSGEEGTCLIHVTKIKKEVGRSGDSEESRWHVVTE